MRTTLLIAGCLTILATRVMGQERARVQATLHGIGTPEAHVAVQDLLADHRFLGAMESGFPLYLEYRVELRQSRSLWDRTVAVEEWEFVILYDPVRDRYVVEDAGGTEIVPTRDLLEERLASVYVVRMQPDREGEFHYRASVNARTLSDDDVDEVFAWLKGENVDSVPRDRPGLFTRVVRRLAVQVAPLPSADLEGRTGDFRFSRQ